MLVERSANTAHPSQPGTERNSRTNRDRMGIERGRFRCRFYACGRSTAPHAPSHDRARKERRGQFRRGSTRRQGRRTVSVLAPRITQHPKILLALIDETGRGYHPNIKALQFRHHLWVEQICQSFTPQGSSHCCEIHLESNCKHSRVGWLRRTRNIIHVEQYKISTSMRHVEMLIQLR